MSALATAQALEFSGFSLLPLQLDQDQKIDFGNWIASDGTATILTPYSANTNVTANTS